MENRPNTNISRRTLLSALGNSSAFLLAPRWARAEGIRRWRAYWNTPYGQVHVHNAAPSGSGAQRTPLMCFHPTAYSGAFFAEYQELMAEDRWVICPDTPGFGASYKPEAYPNMEQYASAMAAVLDGLGFGNGGAGAVDVLGFHTGCFIATELAVLRPDLVRRLVLPGIPYDTGKERKEQLERTAKPSPLYKDPEELSRMWKERFEWQGEAVSLPRLLQLLGEELLSGPNYWWAYRAVFTYEAQERLPLVKAPTLAIATGGDLFEKTQAAAALIPNATVENYPDREAPLFNKHYELMADVTRRYLDAPG